MYDIVRCADEYVQEGCSSGACILELRAPDSHRRPQRPLNL